MEHMDPDVRAVITGWGSPKLDLEALAAAPNLEIVAHAAGTVRPYVDESAWDNGIRVTHAADVIAEAVAEYTIGAILLGLRGFIEHQATLRAGGWKQSSGGSNIGGLLAERRVGVVAASLVGAPRDSVAAGLHARRRPVRPVRRRAGGPPNWACSWRTWTR